MATDSDYTVVIPILQWHKRIIICAETHLGGGVMSPFVSPLSAITRAHDPAV